jgi:hypothetical protein
LRRAQQMRGAQCARASRVLSSPRAKSVIARSKTSAIAPRASILPWTAIIVWNTLYLGRAVDELRMSFLPISRRSDGSISPSTAITSGPPNRSEMPFGPYETGAPNSSTRLSVGFRTDSTMAPCGLRQETQTNSASGVASPQRSRATESSRPSSRGYPQKSATRLRRRECVRDRPAAAVQNRTVRYDFHD